MPEVNLYKIDKTRTESIAYGSKSIEHDSPRLDFARTTAQLPAQKIPTTWHYAIPAAAFQHVIDPLFHWIETVDPSTTRNDLLDNQDTLVRQVIKLILNLVNVPYKENLATILNTLFNDAKEEEPNSRGIRIGSILNFYNFLRENPNVKCPIISLTPNYNIYTSWRDENKVLSIHFLPTDEVRIVIIMPNSKHPEHTDKISIATTADMIMKAIEPSNLIDWISE